MSAKRHRRHLAELPEPEILPMMNVLFMLVMVLMGMSAFLPLGVITTEAPKIGGAAAPSGKKELNLVVMLLKDGINLSVSGSLLKGEGGGPYLPKIQQGEKSVYNFKALGDKLAELKKESPEETRVMVMSDPDVIYDDIVKLMDSAREREGKLMFPGVVFVPGVIN